MYRRCSSLSSTAAVQVFLSPLHDRVIAMVANNRTTLDDCRTAVRPEPIRVSSPWAARALTFLMVFGPGLIVMEADNDAGAVSTYVQAGAQYGTHLLWLLLLLLPITYFVQEMVVRLGIATGQGHAAMIYRRFGIRLDVGPARVAHANTWRSGVTRSRNRLLHQANGVMSGSRRRSQQARSANRQASSRASSGKSIKMSTSLL